jgi:hypothetical protein
MPTEKEYYVSSLGVFHLSLCWLLVTASIVPSSQIVVTLVTEVQHSHEILFLTRATWHKVPEGGILRSLT